MTARSEASGMRLKDAANALGLAFMRAFDIPGLAVALIPEQGDPIKLCLGVRSLGEPEPVDHKTQFAIASLSKAFLAACLAIEVDRGRIGWDDAVVDHLPEFRMADEASTRLMTIRDLLVHRSGLPLGAADLMVIRAGTATAEQVMAALRHFPTERGFRAGYAYDNCLYIVAGLLLERVTGKTWNEFLPANIFAPLGMAGAVPNPSLSTTTNRAARHARLGPPLIGMGPIERIEPRETDVNGPAGGIEASIDDIVPWMLVQLNRGELPGGDRLWSEGQTREMWMPQTIIASGPGPNAIAPHRAVIEGYALGWGVNDYRGHRMLTHAGGLAGACSRLALLPDARLGIAVFSNSSDAEPISALRYALLDLLLGYHPFDWLEYARATIASQQELAKDIVAKGFEPAPGEPTLPLDAYAGRYRDPWYGDVVVLRSSDGLRVEFLPTPGFAGPLEPFGPESFRTRFARGTGEDAVLTFEVQGMGVTGLKMAALSPFADFSFDYHHLNLVRV